MHDGIIALQKPVLGRNGRKINAISVRRGQKVYIAIQSVNTSKDVFGADALSFRPERWLEADLTSKGKGYMTLPPILSFLGGPRGCIGVRFAMLECKVVLFKLIDAFEFAGRDDHGTAIVSSFLSFVDRADAAQTRRPRSAE